MKGKAILWLPLALMGALFLVFYIGLLRPDDHVIASQLVGKQLPEINAAPAFPDRGGAVSADFADGKPRLLNVFASWCVPCVQEIPMLMELKNQGVEIVGVAVHDNVPALSKFLAENGDPYTRIGLDQQGQAQIALGSAGVPETFVIDGQGKVLYQHIGVVTPDDFPKLKAMLGVRQ